MKRRTALLSLLLAAAFLSPAAALTLTAAGMDNSPPIAEDLTLTTYKNVAIQGQCAAVDPEGDLISFRLVEKPARGSVELAENGAFCYTPYENKKGKDSFTYVAEDETGNVSREAVVKITIRKQADKMTYSDMAGHEAHYAALRLAEEGIFVGSRVGSVYCFRPEETVARGEFLTMAMTAAGAEALDGVTLTGFSDDEGIPTWAKGYVSAAVMSGTVRGRMDGGQVVFRSDSAITAVEAAVMIDRLLTMGDVSGESDFPEDIVPTWAYQSVVNMEAVQVVSADTALSEPLTRGEAALMLSAMLDVVESRESKGIFG